MASKCKCKRIISIILSICMVLTIFNGLSFHVTATTSGDINGDGNIDASDALEILKYATRLVKLEDQLLATLGDINGDGNMDASDALVIIKYAAKIIDSIVPSEEPVKDNSSQYAILECDGNKATITIYTTPFNIFDIAIYTNGVSCERISLTKDFNLNVWGKADCFGAYVANPVAIDENGNEYAVITGACVTYADDSEVPYEGAIAKFEYTIEDSYGVFTVVTGSASVDDITQAEELIVLNEAPTTEPPEEPDINPGGEVIPSEPFINYELGDVDGDGFIDAEDALVILKHAARLSMLTDTQLLAADTSKDGSIDASDSLLILKYAARLISDF